MKGRYGLYAEKSLVISPLAYLQRQSARSQHARRRVTCYQQTYQDLKATAEGAYAHASELLPKLEEARRVAQDAREPASEAERRWQEAHGQLSEVQSSAHAAIQELRAGSHTALGGPQAATAAALAHHTHHRLEAFKHALPNVTLWRRFPPSAFPLTWLPCASVHMEAVACTSDDAPYLIACISVGSAPLDDTLRSIALHWSVAEGPGAAWMGTIPRGWHTSPSVSQPCGARAWETALAAHAPVLSGNPASSAPVFSVVVQVPLEGFLRYQGGIKFVLKRTDGGHPEWIKPSDHADFFVDFAQPIKLFQALNSGAEEAALASSLGLPDGAFGPKERSAAAADSIDDWGWARALASDDEGPRVEDIVALFGVDDQEVAKKVPGGWLRGVSRWEDLGDMNPPHTNHSLSDQVQQLRAILLAARAHPEVDEEETLRAQRADQVAALLARCDEVTGTLHTYDMASLEATRVLHEKNALWESHKGATDEVAHLQNEVTAAVDAARRAVVALRGRRAEVTVRDLEAVAAQMAESTVKGGSVWPFSAFGGRQLAFVSERVMSVAGVDASVLVQIYLEGDKSAVAAALAPKPAEPQSEPAPPVEGRAEAAEQPVSALGPSEEGEEDGDAAPSDPLPSTAAPKGGAKAAAPAFDTVVVAVAAGEAFPDVGLPPPLMLHFGAVSHEFGRWRAPPAGWRSEPGVEGGPPGSLPWVPLQQFSIQRPDGSPAFVDAQLHAACVRLPLKDVAAARIRGLEFVLKTGDGRWLKQGGGNFYAELPLLLR